MVESDKAKFAKLFRLCCLNHGKEVDPDLIRLFWTALADASIEDVQQAFADHVLYSKFMPTVAEIRERVAAASRSRRRALPAPPKPRKPVDPDARMSADTLRELGVAEEDLPAAVALGIRPGQRFWVLGVAIRLNRSVVEVVKAAIDAGVDFSLPKSEVESTLVQRLCGRVEREPDLIPF